jgi:ribonuclease VapC
MADATRIAIDTSAVMAILLFEAQGDACRARIKASAGFVISAGTLAEMRIVAHMRNLDAAIRDLLGQLDATIAVVDRSVADRVAAAHARWGRGVHPAALNMGDCYAYDAAISHGLPLLFVGNNFSRTDVRPALPAPAGSDHNRATQR